MRGARPVPGAMLPPMRHLTSSAADEVTQATMDPEIQADADGKSQPVRQDERVTAYAIDYLYRGLPLIVGNLALMPIVMGALMWNRVEHWLIGAWVVLALATGASRLFLARAYSRRQPVADEARIWAQYFTVTSLVSGLTWGAAGMLFFVPGAVAHQVFLYVSIVGLASGSLIVTAYWLPSFYAYALPSVGMSAVFLAFQEDWAHRGLGALLLMFLLIIAKVARQQNRTAIEAVTLRFENLDLVGELRRQTLVAEQANAAKSRFLAAASHDLRQPLHALQLFVASLSPSLKLDDQVEVVSGIRRTVASLDTLFNALLDISRLDAGLLKPQVKSFRLSELLDRFLPEFRVQAQAKGLDFQVRAEGWVVKSDPALLETMLRNLLGNALRYTHTGQITLEVDGDADTVRILVRDTGIGIAPELQKEIFAEYFQVANPERDRNKGLGLGLAIVDRLARLLDHGIQVHSQPGVGSGFILELPAGEREEALHERTLTGLEQNEFAGMTVLVIDDEQLVREGMRTLLESWGCRVLLAENAEEGRLAIAANGVVPDLLIADYRLREHRTGAEAVGELRQRFGAVLPALLITGDTAPDRLREAQASGLPLMHKPVPPARLRVFLRQTRARVA